MALKQVLNLFIYFNSTTAQHKHRPKTLVNTAVNTMVRQSAREHHRQIQTNEEIQTRN
jgi:hypothetical protein